MVIPRWEGVYHYVCCVTLWNDGIVVSSWCCCFVRKKLFSTEQWRECVLGRPLALWSVAWPLFHYCWSCRWFPCCRRTFFFVFLDVLRTLDWFCALVIVSALKEITYYFCKGLILCGFGDDYFSMKQPWMVNVAHFVTTSISVGAHCWIIFL